ncbi:MAG: DUF5343 domain-containing protein [Thermodesulfovibrionia bacterium]|nr:DUF5343 domain-containing protein [Thermodesulfovibrionia bacterium]
MARASEEKPKLPYAGRGDTIKIFKLIHERREPKPINNQKLKTLGIGSPTYVIAMLNTLGFLNDDNTLSNTANDLRGTPDKFKQCLKDKISVVYEDLFNTVKDALNSENDNEVRNYFKNHFTDVKQSMLRMITNCFLALRDVVNSDGDLISLESQQKKPIKETPENINKKEKAQSRATVIDPHKPHSGDIKLILNLNINLDIGVSREAIEELFKNIYSAKKSVFGENK